MSAGVVARCAALDILDDPEFDALVAENAHECNDPELSGPAPDRALYCALESSGATICFRCELDGRMCGYAVTLVSPSGHNGKRYATTESLFVSTGGRAYGLGLRLMEAVADAGREAGCEALLIVAHVGTRLARLLFLSPGKYANTGYVFRRRLG